MRGILAGPGAAATLAVGCAGTASGAAAWTAPVAATTSAAINVKAPSRFVKILIADSSIAAGSSLARQLHVVGKLECPMVNDLCTGHRAIAAGSLASGLPRALTR
jgi:hypothetical protein